MPIMRPPITDEDEENVNEFVVSSIGRSVEKMLYGRLLDRLEEAGNPDLTDAQRKSAADRRYEVRDILMEWRNRREDLIDASKKDDAA